jgi:hypothetical protein
MLGQVPVDGIDVSKFDDKYFEKIKAKKTKTADGMLPFSPSSLFT